MAILSSMLAASEPSGTWITIIKAFEAVTSNYILAIIFLTVVIKLVTDLIGIFQKLNSQKMSELNAKAQPELKAVREKYEKRPELLRQKENEINKKYYGNKAYFGSCLVTLLTTVISFAIFWTLLPALNSMASYKITTNYENLKFNYANCLNVVDKYYNDSNISNIEKNKMFSDYKNLEFIVGEEDGTKNISLVHIGEDKSTKILYKTSYIDDFSEKEVVSTPEEEEKTIIKVTSNENIIKLIDKYFKDEVETQKENNSDESVNDEVSSQSQRKSTFSLVKPLSDYFDDESDDDIVVYIGDRVVGYETKTNEEGLEEQVAIRLTDTINYSISNQIVKEYDRTQDKFLWIQNIWIADSPSNKSILNYSSLRSQAYGGFEEGEDVIYDAFMPQLKEERNRTNGYFILTILCILIPILSMQLTKIYNKKKLERKRKKEGIKEPDPVPPTGMAKWLPIALPFILGLFTLLYNSAFSIYIVTGQVVSFVTSIPQLMFVDWVYGKLKKKEKNEITKSNDLDYSRKF